MSVKSIPPHTPLLYSKTGVCRGKPTDDFSAENFQFLKRKKISVYCMGKFS